MLRAGMPIKFGNGEKEKKEDRAGRQEELSDYKRIRNQLIAGGVAGFISRTLTAPLERLKVMAQIKGRNYFPLAGARMMIKEGGFLSMWRGNGTNLLKVIPEIAIKFSCFNELKHHLTKDEPRRVMSLKESLLAGGLAGAFAHTIVHPLEVCKTRMVLRKTGDPKGLINSVYRGMKIHGWKYLYLGYAPSLVGKVIFSSIDYCVYELTKEACLMRPLWLITNNYILFSGTCSSIAANLAAHPFGVLGAYIQASACRLNRKDVLRFVARRGPLGIYRGLPTVLLKGVPTFCIAYLTYERTYELLSDTRSDPRAKI